MRALAFALVLNAIAAPAFGQTPQGAGDVLSRACGLFPSDDDRGACMAELKSLRNRALASPFKPGVKVAAPAGATVMRPISGGATPNSLFSEPSVLGSNCVGCNILETTEFLTAKKGDTFYILGANGQYIPSVVVAVDQADKNLSVLKPSGEIAKLSALDLYSQKAVQERSASNVGAAILMLGAFAALSGDPSRRSPAESDQLPPVTPPPLAEAESGAVIVVPR